MGGNHFKDYKVRKVKKEEVFETQSIYNKLLNEFVKNKFISNTILLGSSGKKDISGDIDIGLDEYWLNNAISFNKLNLTQDFYYNKFKKRARTATDKDLLLKANCQILANYLEKQDNIIVDNKVGIGHIFTLYKKDNEYIQVDLMVGDLDLLSYTYYSEDYKGNVKGLHRTQLLVALFQNFGYIMSHTKGLIDKETNKRYTNPKEWFQIEPLRGFDFNKTYNFYDLLNEIENYLDEEDYIKILDIYFNILSHTKCDIPDILQDFWKARNNIHNFKTDFLPEDSKLKI